MSPPGGHDELWQEARETTVPLHGIFYGILESLGGLGYTLSLLLPDVSLLQHCHITFHKPR